MWGYLPLSLSFLPVKWDVIVSISRGGVMRIRWDDSLEKTLMLGKIEGRRRKGHRRMRWLDGITNASMNLGKLWEMVRSGRPGVSELDMTGWLNNNNNKPYPAGNELTFSDSYFPLADSFHLWLKSNLPNSQPIKSRPVVFYFSLSSWSSEHASDLLSTEEGDSTYLKLESLYCSFFVCVCSRNMFLLSLINIKF